MLHIIKWHGAALQILCTSSKVCYLSAALEAGGISGKQSTGVFASEPGRSGCTQLLDSIDARPPLAHEAPHGPSSQNQPSLLLHSQAVEPRNAPHESHQSQQQQQQQQPAQRGQASKVDHQTAEPQQEQPAMDFQYDSLSDSLEDGHVLGMLQPGDADAECLNQELAEPAGQALHQLSEQQHAQPPGDLPDQARALEQQNQEELPGGTTDVIPQTDGAADSDPLDTSVPTAAKLQASRLPPHTWPTNGTLDPLTTTARPAATLSSALPLTAAHQADTGAPANQCLNQAVAGEPAAVAMPNPCQRRRRSRHVVQHAVLLAAAARNAMVAAGLPEEGEVRPQDLPPGQQSEPQLPSWLREHAPSRRQFQSEPQLPDLLHHAGIGANADCDNTVKGALQHTAEQHHAQALHHNRSQYGAIGKQHRHAPNHHQHSQQTVAGPNNQAHIGSQVVSDSRAMSDLLWQNRQQPSQGMLSPLLHARLLASQVVSDSRASSDHKWAQGLSLQQTAAQELPEVSNQPGSHPFVQNVVTPSIELAWEEAEHQAVIINNDTSLPEASEAAGMPDDFEIVISDSQPSQPHEPGSFLGSSQTVKAIRPEESAEQAVTSGQAINQFNRAEAITPSPVNEQILASPELPHNRQQAPAADAVVSPAANGDDFTESPMELAPRQQHEPHTVALNVADTPAAGQLHYLDQELLRMPTFSTRLNAAETPAGEALTPVMMPYAHARIQAQHGGTPSVAVVKDTPQSAVAIASWTSVKDTPAATSVPHTFWLGFDQQPAANRPSVSGAQAAIRMPQAGLATPSAASQPNLPQSQLVVEQHQPTPSVPELTLRLSLSDVSSTKSVKAGQPSPGTDLPLIGTQTSSQPGPLTTPLHHLPLQSAHAQDSHFQALSTERQRQPSSSRLGQELMNAQQPESSLPAAQPADRDLFLDHQPSPPVSQPQTRLSRTALEGSITSRLQGSQGQAPAGLASSLNTSSETGSLRHARDAPYPAGHAVAAAGMATLASGGGNDRGNSDGRKGSIQEFTRSPPADDSHDLHNPYDQAVDHDDTERQASLDDVMEHDSHDPGGDPAIDDEPDNSEPGGSGYSLSHGVVPHRYKQRAPTQVMITATVH